eukprot:Rhum_TRINITY_DN2395_c0_g1::Rhum_TRINITY_DN2395_c0_g1_i1::g.7049::m.7049
MLQLLREVPLALPRQHVAGLPAVPQLRHTLLDGLPGPVAVGQLTQGRQGGGRSLLAAAVDGGAHHLRRRRHAELREHARVRAPVLRDKRLVQGRRVREGRLHAAALQRRHALEERVLLDEAGRPRRPVDEGVGPQEVAPCLQLAVELRDNRGPRQQVQVALASHVAGQDLVRVAQAQVHPVEHVADVTVRDARADVSPPTVLPRQLVVVRRPEVSAPPHHDERHLRRRRRPPHHVGRVHPHLRVLRAGHVEHVAVPVVPQRVEQPHQHARLVHHVRVERLRVEGLRDGGRLPAVRLAHAGHALPAHRGRHGEVRLSAVTAAIILVPVEHTHLLAWLVRAAVHLAAVVHRHGGSLRGKRRLGLLVLVVLVVVVVVVVV